jgi:hypothetical protein
MTAAKRAMGLLWGERTSLIHKSMVYAFSLEVRARSRGPYLTVERAAPSRGDAHGQYGVRHLFEETTVVIPEGLRCDVPTGYVESGTGKIGDTLDPTSCWLELRVRSSLEGGDARLYFDATGVVNFDGGPTAFRSTRSRKITGQAFMTSCQEASTATYRWLERRQLFGVGRVEGESVSERTAEWLLDFSFDLYAAL